MFCTIEDAWGSDFNDGKSTESDDFNRNEYKMPDSEESKVERKEYMQYMKLKEKFDNDTTNKVCVAVNTHINQCPACKARYLGNKEHFTLPSISGFLDNLRVNSDVMVIVLLCLLILLIVKLFTSK